MSRDSQVGNLRIVRMRAGIESIGEEPVDAVTAELSGRQADAVHYHQLNGGALGPIVLVGRWMALGLLQPS